MAQVYPNADFVGVDIHNMSPANLFANTDIRAPWDYEGPWALGEQSWDLIHLQLGLGSVSNWRNLFRKIIRHLKPGGYFEWVEIDFQPRCDDGTLKPGRLRDWWEFYVSKQFDDVGRPMRYPGDDVAKSMLREAGFRDVESESYILPMNGWGEGGAQRAGMWWNIILSPAVPGGSTGGHGMEAMSLAPLCRCSGWLPEHVHRLCEEALQQASDPNVHAYNTIHVLTARAPKEDGT
jgi:hypothetical protein